MKDPATRVPGISCGALLEQRDRLAAPAVGLALRRPCEVRGDRCGDAKDFAAVHPSSP
jgi:hypothetical protein